MASEPIVPGYMRVITLDGARKGREYYFREGTPEFGITSLVPGSSEAAYYGGRLSGYGQYIYKVVAIWGFSFDTKVYGGVFHRLAYR